METKDIFAMNREALLVEFNAWVERQNADGLVDIKFCVQPGGAQEDALRQLLYIQKLEDNGELRPFVDF